MEKRIQTIASLKAPSFSAHLDEVLLRDGTEGKRIRIDHPEATAIIPFVSKNEIVMVRQFRYALGKETLEIPAGKVDPGESLEGCARRELLEETGYEAEEIQFIYTYAPAIGYSNELIHIYSAHNLKKLNVEIDGREINSLEMLSIERIEGLVKQGLIQDGKTLIALYLVEMVGA